jgi:hypothetical protein
MDEDISGIIERTLAYHAEALAWRPSKHDIDGVLSYPRMFTNVCAANIGHTSANRCAVGEVKLMGCTVDRIVFDGCGNVKARLLETKAHPARTREKIDTNGSSG